MEKWPLRHSKVHILVPLPRNQFFLIGASAGAHLAVVEGGPEKGDAEKDPVGVRESQGGHRARKRILRFSKERVSSFEHFPRLVLRA